MNNTELELLITSIKFNFLVLSVGIVCFLYLRIIRGDSINKSCLVSFSQNPHPPTSEIGSLQFIYPRRRNDDPDIDISLSSSRRNLHSNNSESQFSFAIECINPDRFAKATSFFHPNEDINTKPTCIQSIKQSFDFRWVVFLFKTNFDQSKSTDVLFFLSFLKLCQKNSMILMFFIVTVIIPVYMTAPSPERRTDILFKASAANILKSPWRIWLLYVATWIFSFITYYQIYGFHFYVSKVLSHQRPKKALAQNYTIQLCGIDQSWISDRIIRDHFEKLFPNMVISVYLVLDYRKVNTAFTKLHDAIEKFKRRSETHSESPLSSLQAIFSENYIYRLPYALEQIRTIQLYNYPPKTYCFCCKLKDNVTLLNDIANKMKKYIQLEKSKTKNNAGIAFVSFNSTECVAKCLHDMRAIQQFPAWSVSKAPPYADIIWDYVHVKTWKRVFLGSINSLCMLLVALLAVIPTQLIIEHTDLFLNQYMSKKKFNFIKTQLSSWGPPLWVSIINCILVPYLIALAADRTKFARLSYKDSSILHGNIIFLFLNTILSACLSQATYLIDFTKVFNDITQLNSYLAKNLYFQTSSFAIRYLVGASCLSAVAELIQIAQLLYFLICTIFKKPKKKWQLNFGYQYAITLSYFFLMMSFCLATPPVLLVAPFCFTIRYWVAKYNFLYGVWQADCESNGFVATNSVRYLISAVAFFQFLVSGFMILCSTSLMSPSNHRDSSDFNVSRQFALAGCLMLSISILTFLCFWSSTLFPSNIEQKKYFRGEKENYEKLQLNEIRAVTTAYYQPHDKRLLLSMY